MTNEQTTWTQWEPHEDADGISVMVKTPETWVEFQIKEVEFADSDAERSFRDCILADHNTLEDQRRLLEEATKLLAEEYESYPSGRAMGPEKTDWLFRVAAFLSKLVKGGQTDE